MVHTMVAARACTRYPSPVGVAERRDQFATFPAFAMAADIRIDGRLQRPSVHTKQGAVRQGHRSQHEATLLHVRVSQCELSVVVTL
eukprot:12685414-Alexandrium_andersonii.AAC.1